MKIDLVVFDMAGTTVRDDDAVNVCLRDALAAAGEVVSRDDVNGVMGIPKPVAIRELLVKKAGQAPAPERVSAIHEDFMQRMIRHYQTSGAVEPMPQAVETFSRLKKAGVRVVLDTGFNRPIVDAILARLGWSKTELIDATVCSDEVARGRPHADLVVKAMELTGIKEPQAVAKVGDTPSDLEEGKAAGCGLVVGVTNGSHTAAQLKPFHHTHLIADLGELPAIVLNGK